MLDIGLLMYVVLLWLAVWRGAFFYECCGVWLSCFTYTSLLYSMLIVFLLYCLVLFYWLAFDSLTSLEYPEVEGLWSVEWLRGIVFIAPAAVVITVALNLALNESHVFEIRKHVASPLLRMKHDRAVQIIALPAVFGVMALASMVPILELATGKLSVETLDSPWYDFQHPLSVLSADLPTTGEGGLALRPVPAGSQSSSSWLRPAKPVEPAGPHPTKVRKLEWEEAKQLALWRCETCFYVADLFEAWALYQFGKLALSLIEESTNQRVALQNPEAGGDHERLRQELKASQGAVSSLTWLGTTIFIAVCIGQTACSLWPYVRGGAKDPKQESIMFHFQVAGFFASASAIYNLVIVERTFHDHLEACSPLKKFLSVKILVSFSFIQHGLITLLQTLESMLPAVVQKIVHWVPLFGDLMSFSDVQLHLFYPSLLLFECFLLAIMHCWVWQPHEKWYKADENVGSETQPLLPEQQGKLMQ